MKCPKCHYIGFEATDRCRNCGYEFSLADDVAAAPDLSIAMDDEPGPLADLAFREDTPAASGRPATPRALDLDRVIGAPEPAMPGPSATAPDLPLFSASATPASDRRIQTPAPPGTLRTPSPATPHTPAPRRPLGGRRPVIEPPRLRPRQRDPRVETATLDLPLPPVAAPGEAVDRMSLETTIMGPAPFGTRVAAGAIDLVLLGAIDLVTVWLTLRLVGLTFAEWHVLPLAPLAAFFLILNGGYLTLFTVASGQTIGKMSLGLKVVSEDAGPVPPGAASLRALAALASTVCLGMGLWPAAADDEGRALHDRLAQTRVVRVGA